MATPLTHSFIHEVDVKITQLCQLPPSLHAPAAKGARAGSETATSDPASLLVTAGPAAVAVAETEEKREMK